MEVFESDLARSFDSMRIGLKSLEEQMTLRLSKKSSEGEGGSNGHDQRQPASQKAILRDLYELLEDYGPAWYTEEHHNRAIAALLDRAS